MIENLLSKQSKECVNSPTKVATLSQSYFDVITQRLDSWQAKQAVIQAEQSQLKKSFILTDEDPLNGEIRSYKVTVELLQTSKSALELHDQADLESEVMDYAN